MTDYSNNPFGAAIDTGEITDGSITAVKIADGTITADKLATSASNALSSPIGSVIAWLKSFTNTPALPSGWVECNGQVLSDAGSVYNGQTIPDLNGENRFLRGNATSGTTGGSATNSHTHSVTRPGVGNADAGGSYTSLWNGGNATSGGPSDTENRPPFYDIVWIMRVK